MYCLRGEKRGGTDCQGKAGGSVSRPQGMGPPGLSDERRVKIAKSCAQTPKRDPKAAKPSPRSPTRQQIFRDKFIRSTEKVKNGYGYGVYSFSEGMTRKAQRRIAKKLARKIS